MLDSLALEINTISEKSISEKRKQIFGIINNHFALNININVDNSLKEQEVISIIENALEKHRVQNDYHFSITDQSGLLIQSNFEDIDNDILKSSTSFSDEFLNDELFTEKEYLPLHS